MTVLVAESFFVGGDSQELRSLGYTEVETLFSFSEHDFHKINCKCTHAKVMHAAFFNFRSFHIRNFSLEGLPFYLGVAIYCYEVGDCLRAQ